VLSAGEATRSAGEASAFRVIFAYFSNPTFSLSLSPHFFSIFLWFRQREKESSKFVQSALKLGKSKVEPRNLPQISSSPPIWYSFHYFSLYWKLRFLDFSGFHFKPEICVRTSCKLAPWASLMVYLSILSRFHLDFRFPFLGFSCQNWNWDIIVNWFV
jgi:hypothetical protein